MVSEEVLDTVTAALEGPVEVRPQRRGFGHRRGVPDSVFWLTPADNRFTCTPLPVLVELEGSFANALNDFGEFANRYDDDDYQYSIQVPIIGDFGAKRQMKRLEYDIIGIRANLLNGDPEISEGQMHAEFESWFERFKSKFQTRATVRKHLPQPVVEWGLTFTIFGHEFETVVPFILAGPDRVSDKTVARITTPTLLGVVVVNNKYDSRDQTTLQHKTGIDFPRLHSIRFSK